MLCTVTDSMGERRRYTAVSRSGKRGAGSRPSHAEQACCPAERHGTLLGRLHGRGRVEPRRASGTASLTLHMEPKTEPERVADPSALKHPHWNNTKQRHEDGPQPVILARPTRLRGSVITETDTLRALVRLHCNCNHWVGGAGFRRWFFI